MAEIKKRDVTYGPPLTTMLLNIDIILNSDSFISIHLLFIPTDPQTAATAEATETAVALQATAKAAELQVSPTASTSGQDLSTTVPGLFQSIV